MLIDVINFVKSRTGLVDRDTILREINFAWQELWNGDEIPGTLFEITAKPADDSFIISLPHYVGKIRGVKESESKLRIALNTPRPYYHDDSYNQSQLTWRVLGNSPLVRHINNATTMTVGFPEAQSMTVKVTLRGPTDNASESSEVITFSPGDTAVEIQSRFTDLVSLTKDVVTDQDLLLTDSNGLLIASIPNCNLEANNTLCQIRDRCDQLARITCYDILYKRTPPVLSHDATVITVEAALMAKTLEWITLPKEGGAQLYGLKSHAMLSVVNNNNASVPQKLDLGTNQFVTHHGHYL